MKRRNLQRGSNSHTAASQHRSPPHQQPQNQWVTWRPRRSALLLWLLITALTAWVGFLLWLAISP